MLRLDKPASFLGRAVRRRARDVYRRLRHAATSLLIERPLGISTSRYIARTDQRIGPSAAGSDYEASPWLTLRLALSPSDVTQDDVFLDLGSGMGRVVYHAATAYPFRRVIGVEVSPALHAMAQRNIATARRRPSCEAELICADARVYAVPVDVTYVYAYNPFMGAVFAAVMENVIASYDRNPRPMRLLYRTPHEHDYLISTGRFRLVRSVRGLRPGRRWSQTSATNIYEVLPADAKLSSPAV